MVILFSEQMSPVRPKTSWHLNVTTVNCSKRMYYFRVNIIRKSFQDFKDGITCHYITNIVNWRLCSSPYIIFPYKMLFTMSIRATSPKQTTVDLLKGGQRKVWVLTNLPYMHSFIPALSQTITETPMLWTICIYSVVWNSILSRVLIFR